MQIQCTVAFALSKEHQKKKQTATMTIKIKTTTTRNEYYFQIKQRFEDSARAKSDCKPKQLQQQHFPN